MTIYVSMLSAASFDLKWWQKTLKKHLARSHLKISRFWIFLNSLYQGLFLFLRFWVIGPVNVPFATLNSRKPL